MTLLGVCYEIRCLSLDSRSTGGSFFGTPNQELPPYYTTLSYDLPGPVYTVRQLYNETDFILTKIEVLSMTQCMPSM